MGIKHVTIKKGDNLTKLATKYDTTVEDLVSINKDTIKDPNLIYVGNKLNVEDVSLNPMQTMKVIEDANKKNVQPHQQNETINNYSHTLDDFNYQKNNKINSAESTVTNIKNNDVSKGDNLRDRGYSSSTDGYKPENLSAKGYSSSTDGYKPENLSAKGYSNSTEGNNYQKNNNINSTNNIESAIASIKSNNISKADKTIDDFMNRKTTNAENLSAKGYSNSKDGYKAGDLSSRGYSSSTDGYKPENLSAKGYSNSTDGYKAGDLSARGYSNSTDGYNVNNDSQQATNVAENKSSNNQTNNTVNNATSQANNNPTVNNSSYQEMTQQANTIENNSQNVVDPFIASTSQMVASNPAMDTVLTNGIVGNYDGKFVSMPNAIDLDNSIRTAFAEGAYASEEDARKIADSMLNRAKDSGNSLINVVTAKNQFVAYKSNNWGWRNYGNGPEPGSIGTERVKEIFMEELNKAVNGYELTYPVKNFRGRDGKNYYW